MKFHISEEMAEIIASNVLGTAGDRERGELAAWLAESGENRAFYAKVADPANTRRFLDEIEHYDAGRDWPRVLEKRRARSRERRGNVRRLMSCAAAVVVAVCAVWFFVAERGEAEKTGRALTAQAASAIPPGGTRAVLTTGTGEVFELDAGDIRRTESFSLDGDVLDYAAGDPSALPSTHTLRTPRGGEHRLVLSDGSRVWLNAESELRFPTIFTAGTREVELSGEACFIVAADAAHPFVVRSGDRSTTAVGTAFNVRTYDNYQSTLLSGKAVVRAGDAAVSLLPGQQAMVGGSVGETIGVRDVAAADYTNWKDGRFVYRNLTLREVMADMARWYDVEVSFADERTANIRLTADIRKYEDLHAALEIVGRAAWVDIGMSGREVCVRRKR